MADANLGALVVRMVVSLVVVLGIVLGAYVVVRRRGGGGGFGGAMSRAPRNRRAPSPRGNRAALRVLARTGLGRSTGVAAVQFADRVLLVGSSEQGAPSLLAEMTYEQWSELTAPVEELAPIDPVPIDTNAGAAGPLRRAGAATPPGLLDALREATTRRA